MGYTGNRNFYKVTWMPTKSLGPVQRYLMQFKLIICQFLTALAKLLLSSLPVITFK